MSDPNVLSEMFNGQIKTETSLNEGDRSKKKSIGTWAWKEICMCFAWVFPQVDAIVVFIAGLSEIQGRVCCWIVVMGSIPRPFYKWPKTFHSVGMYPTRLPFLTPVHRFMLHHHTPARFLLQSQIAWKLATRLGFSLRLPSMRCQKPLLKGYFRPLKEYRVCHLGGGFTFMAVIVPDTSCIRFVASPNVCRLTMRTFRWSVPPQTLQGHYTILLRREYFHDFY